MCVWCVSIMFTFGHLETHLPQYLPKFVHFIEKLSYAASMYGSLIFLKVMCDNKCLAVFNPFFYSFIFNVIHVQAYSMSLNI